MRRTNLIRVHDVSILCRHRIHARDVILKVDNVPIENWSYTTLNDYLSNIAKIVNIISFLFMQF